VIIALKDEYVKAGFQWEESRRLNYEASLANGTKPSGLFAKEARTGICFFIRQKTLYINRINTNICHRRKGLAVKMLEPIIKIYKAFDLKSITLVSTNDSFWIHIIEKYPEINFKIGFHHANSFSIALKRRLAALDELEKSTS
jgi:hypothetical protein